MTEDGPSDLECEIEVLGLVGLATTIPAAFGGGLLAGGAARMGRRQATLDVRTHARRDVRKRVALGWALFGTGLALYTATRFASFGCADHGCDVALWEGGFWASAALVVPGLVIAPYATAYQRTRPRARAQTLAPFLSITSRTSMIGIAGRF